MKAHVYLQTLLYRMFSQRHKPLVEEARSIAAQFDYTDDDVRKCFVEFMRELNEGLKTRTPTMCQIPTYITRVAQGTEKGLSLAIDLGGTNLRVCSVDLYGDTTYKVKQSRIAHATDLFSFIARQLGAFLETHHRESFSIDSEDQQIFSLGFTFSFPAYQNGINSGILLRWTKGFDIPDAVGQDVCILLQNEIDQLQLPVRITALVNDAAGTIMSRAYTLPISDTRPSIGAIFGTGTNGVYPEKLSRITKALEGQHSKLKGEMLISTEWGSFDNHLSVLPVTGYDTELNEASANPGNQMFEKRVSGMFLGELLRIIMSTMYRNRRIRFFQEYKKKNDTTGDEILPLHTRWTVDSSILSVAEADDSDDLLLLRQKIGASFHMSSATVSTEDAQAVKIIAHAIGKRAARLAGMAVGAVVLQSQRLTDPLDRVTTRTETLSSIRNPSNDTSETEFGREDTIERVNEFSPEPENIAVAQNSGLSSIVRDDVSVDIGVDGSVIEHYPRFETYMREAFRTLEGIGVTGEKMIRIGVAKDGSSVGAAIIALLAAQEA